MATSWLGMYNLANTRNNIDAVNRSGQNIQQEIRLLIDLDVERGRPTRDKPDQVRVVIRQAKSRAKIDLNNIYEYLEGKASFGPHVIDAINFLDHLIREWPSKKHYGMKRSYFSRDLGDKYLVSGGVEAMRGVYQSIRAAEVISFTQRLFRTVTD